MKRKATAAQRIARKGRRRRMFGAKAVCFFCQYSNPAGLIPTNKTLLEEHHVVGVHNDDRVRVPVCRNCHAELTEGCMDTGADMHAQRSLLEKIAETYRIGSVFHRATTSMEEDLAAKLDKLVLSLDKHCPNWRSDRETDQQ